MSAWLLTLIPYLKAVHISMIAVWTGGLFALPMMMARHENAVGQADFSRIRQATHRSYTLLVTPAAAAISASISGQTGEWRSRYSSISSGLIVS